MAHVTLELVGKAYEALASGDKTKIKQYWAEDMVWLVPGHNPLSGWYHGLDAFLAFMGNVGALSNNSFNMEGIAVMVSDEYSADVTHNVGYRAGFSQANGAKPYTKLDIDVVHVTWEECSASVVCGTFSAQILSMVCRNAKSIR